MSLAYMRILCIHFVRVGACVRELVRKMRWQHTHSHTCTFTHTHTHTHRWTPVSVSIASIHRCNIIMIPARASPVLPRYRRIQLPTARDRLYLIHLHLFQAEGQDEFISQRGSSIMPPPKIISFPPVCIELGRYAFAPDMLYIFLYLFYKS